ncbi:hypothetical protein, partial [Lactobacillus amylovorus]|uniref:hypothetical protein n=1 Tax=Lactobacillus amylovorus TaxID=1604 RepID=UPI00232EFB5D
TVEITAFLNKFILLSFTTYQSGTFIISRIIGFENDVSAFLYIISVQAFSKVVKWFRPDKLCLFETKKEDLVLFHCFV